MALVDMKEMELNTEVYNRDVGAWITRVPNGWLYKFYSHTLDDETEIYLAPVFVPERDSSW
jgi:hypothetical protein